MIARIIGWFFGAYACILVWRITLRWLRIALNELDPDKVCVRFDKWMKEYEKRKKGDNK